jgi:hypothetical protein
MTMALRNLAPHYCHLGKNALNGSLLLFFNQFSICLVN